MKDLGLSIEIISKSTGLSLEDVEKLYLGVSESTSIKLNAPSGNYKISMESGDLSETFPSVSLTGEAVKVSYESGRERIALVRNIFMISLLVLLSVLFIAKYFRESSYRKRSESRKKDQKFKMYLNPEDDPDNLGIGGENG